MDYDVLEARYVRDYVVWLRFRDGTAGEIDLAPVLRGPVFEPLKDIGVFRQFFIHRLCCTEENQRCRTCSRLISQRGIVIAPENLEEMIKLRQIKTLRKYSFPLRQFEEVFQLSLFVKAQKLL